MLPRKNHAAAPQQKKKYARNSLWRNKHDFQILWLKNPFRKYGLQKIRCSFVAEWRQPVNHPFIKKTLPTGAGGFLNMKLPLDLNYEPLQLLPGPGAEMGGGRQL